MENPLTVPTTCTVTENCPLPVDIVLRSSDGVLLSAHAKNLELFNNSFPNSDHFKSSSATEVVDLSETAEVLQLLLKFTHNKPVHHEILDALPLDTVLELTRTSDKYGNDFGLEACEDAMKRILERPRTSPIDCLKILVFKSRYGFLRNIDLFARRAVDIPLLEAFPYFGGNLQVYSYFTFYKEAWKDRLTDFRQVLASQMDDVPQYLDVWKKMFVEPLEYVKFPTKACLEECEGACMKYLNAFTPAQEGYEDYELIDEYLKGWLDALHEAANAFPVWSTYQQ